MRGRFQPRREHSRPAPAIAVRSASERAIVISPEPFGAGFDVRVEPALPDGRHFGRELATIKAARGYAHELRDELRLGIVDQGDVG